MSYILDALRRADAERERGSVPSLHAQSVLPGGPEQAARRGPRPMTWIVAALSLALVASLAWHFLSRDAERETAPLPAETAAVPTTTPMAAPTTTAPAPTPSAVAVLPPVPTARPAPAPLPSVPLATSARTAPVNAAGPAATPTSPAAVNSTTAAPPTPPADARLPRQDELPEEIRRQLPKFSVGGSIYSESAASRFLILNGQIFHENDKVMPELVLEQIKLKSAVLRFRNQRFTISY